MVLTDISAFNFDANFFEAQWCHQWESKFLDLRRGVLIVLNLSSFQCQYVRNKGKYVEITIEKTVTIPVLLKIICCI